MTNYDMLSDEQKKIAKLSYIIEKFKKYDEERKKHYHNIELEIGFLRDECEELKEQLETSQDSDAKTIKINKQREQITNLKKQILILNSKISLSQATKDVLDGLNDDEIILKSKMLSYKNLIRSQGKTIAELRKFSEETLCKLLNARPTEPKSLISRLESLLSKLSEITKPLEERI